jgi:hypothetical protein
MTLTSPANATLGGVFMYSLLLILPGVVLVYAAVVALRTSELNRAVAVARERQAHAWRRSSPKHS